MQISREIASEIASKIYEESGNKHYVYPQTVTACYNSMGGGYEEFRQAIAPLTRTNSYVVANALHDCGLTPKNMSIVLTKYMDEEKKHKGSAAKSAALEQLIEQMKEEETEGKKKGGKKGGVSTKKYYQGDKVKWQEKVARQAMDFSSLKIMDRKSTRSSIYRQGKPKSRIEHRAYRGTSDIKFFNRRQLMLPPDLLGAQMMTKRLIVQVPMKKLVTVPTILMLLDDSGSMSSSFKVDQVMAVCNELFKQVRSKSINLAIAPFERGRGKFELLNDEKSILEWKKRFRDGSGGNTELNRILPDIEQDIRKGVVDGIQVPNTSQILIVNDGQDRITPYKSTIPISAVCIGQRNIDLKNLCDLNQGQFVYIHEVYDW